MAWYSTGRTARASIALGLLVAVVASAAASKSEAPTPASPAVAQVQAPAKPTFDARGAPTGLENFKKWSDRLAQGGSPEGEEAYRNLAALGFKTVLTVDGARPDIETAERYGLRYVHIPIGYDGVPRDAQLRAIRAVQSSDGPVYVHCHHGTARGPAIAAIARAAIDGTSNDEALKGLKDSGCSPAYTGLFRDVTAFVPPKADEMAGVPFELPSYTPPGDVAVAMVGADTRFDRLKLSKGAKWGVPAGHPDVDPPHEATMLWESLREIGRLDDSKRRGAEFLGLLADAESKAKVLETAIRSRDYAAADAAHAAVKQSCDACHVKYRNN